jgi:hypothetical protein
VLANLLDGRLPQLPHGVYDAPLKFAKEKSEIV